MKQFSIFFYALAALGFGCGNGANTSAEKTSPPITKTITPQPERPASDAPQTQFRKKVWQLSESEKEQYTPEQQKTLEKHLRIFNNPELIEAEAKRRKKKRSAARQNLLRTLEGNGLSYALGKGHLVMYGQTFQAVAKDRCVSVEDIIKSNPRLKLGNNRIVAPFDGLVLNLPDHACSDKNSEHTRDMPIPTP